MSKQKEYALIGIHNLRRDYNSKASQIQILMHTNWYLYFEVKHFSKSFINTIESKDAKFLFPLNSLKRDYQTYSAYMYLPFKCFHAQRAQQSYRAVPKVWQNNLGPLCTYKKCIASGMYTLFFKGQGHQGIFSLGKGVLWANCKVLLAPEHFKGTKAMTRELWGNRLSFLCEVCIRPVACIINTTKIKFLLQQSEFTLMTAVFLTVMKHDQNKFPLITKRSYLISTIDSFQTLM